MNSETRSRRNWMSLGSVAPEQADWRRLAAAAVLLAGLHAGCGRGEGPVRVAVTGTVTLDGEPMTSGLIRFIPRDENDGPGAMAQILDGDYQFAADSGPVPGNHRVEIEATDFQSFAIDDEAAFAREVQLTGVSPLARNPVPARYNTTSILTATVTDADDQRFRFELQSLGTSR